MNVLFIDAENKRRSPTAEAIYKNQQGQDLIVKCAGVEPTATIPITAKLLLWADVIFVMERDHKERTSEKFPLEMMEKEIVNLNIPAKYELMDPELVSKIKTQVDACLIDLNT